MNTFTRIAKLSPTVLGVPLGLLLVATVAAGDYDLDWNTVDGGGVIRSTGGSFELSATIGQPDAGQPLTAGDFELTGGFWFGIVPGDCDEDGGVTLFDYYDLEQCLDGPGGGLTPPACGCFDFDVDNDVDLLDFAEFTIRFTGG